METVPKAAAGEKTKWDEQRKSSARSHLGWFGWLHSVDFTASAAECHRLGTVVQGSLLNQPFQSSFLNQHT